MYYYDVDIDEDVIHYKAFSEDGELVGLLQVRPEEEQYIIEGIYVEPEHRERGIANDLLDDFLDRIGSQNIRPCSCTFSEENAGDELVYFFMNREDFMLIEAGKRFYCRSGELVNAPTIEKLIEKGHGSRVKTLGTLSEKELNLLLIELKKHDLDTVLVSEELTEYYDSELSSIYVEGTDILDAVLVSKVDEENIFIETVFFKGNGVTGMVTAADVFKKIADRNKDIMLSFFAINEASEKLTDHLLEETQNFTKYVTYIANWLMTSY